MQVSELVSQVDLMPTLLEARVLRFRHRSRGAVFLPLLDRKDRRMAQRSVLRDDGVCNGPRIANSAVHLRSGCTETPEWKGVPSADRYVEYAHYDLYADPFQHVNLAGRATHKTVAEELRARLLTRIRETSGATPQIDPSWFPYS